MDLRTHRIIPRHVYWRMHGREQHGIAMQGDYVRSFTTGLISAPEVNPTDPGNMASGVPQNQAISATFSGAIDGATITSTSFKVMEGNDELSGIVDYAGTTATFAPDINLSSPDHIQHQSIGGRDSRYKHPNKSNVQDCFGEM